MNYLELNKGWAWRVPVVSAIVLSFQFGLFKKAHDPKGSTVLSKELNQSIQKWQFVPGSITDGESLKVARGNQKYSIKLCGIDSPELRQPSGNEAKDYLKSLVDKGDGTIFVTPVEEDNQGNIVAELFILIGERKVVLLNSRVFIFLCLRD